MKNINDIISNNPENDNSLINLRINLDKVEEFIQDKKILEILDLVKQSFPFTFIGRQKIRRIIDQLDFAFWIKDPHKKFVIVIILNSCGRSVVKRLICGGKIRG